MKVQTPSGHELVIWFRYGGWEPLQQPKLSQRLGSLNQGFGPGPDHPPEREWTEVNVCVDNDREKVRRMRVTRHYRDIPNRPMARRYALEKLLDAVHIERADRQAIWKAYFANHADLKK